MNSTPNEDIGESSGAQGDPGVRRLATSRSPSIERDYNPENSSSSSGDSDPDSDVEEPPTKKQKSGAQVTVDPRIDALYNQNLKTVHGPSQPSSNQQQNNGEKYSNPFVPLQVQTSQRRVQHTSVPQRRERDGQTPAVRDERDALHTTTFNPQQQASRPQKKKKPRIAANLPFQMD